MALAVPLSRFTSPVAGGSAFYVRQQPNARLGVTNYTMKKLIIIEIMAVSILLTGCGKKPADDADPTGAKRLFEEMKKTVPISQVVAYAIADTSKSTNMIFTITEIWKGLKEGSAVGITNGMQIRLQNPSPSDLPDAAIVTYPLDAGNTESRGMYFVRDGKVADMTVPEVKTKIGL